MSRPRKHSHAKVGRPERPECRRSEEPAAQECTGASSGKEASDDGSIWWADEGGTGGGSITPERAAGRSRGTGEPSFAKIDYKVVTDALTGANGFNYLTVDEVFRCQKEAEDVLQPAINAVVIDGAKVPSSIRDLKTQIDQAASSCGATFK